MQPFSQNDSSPPYNTFINDYLLNQDKQFLSQYNTTEQTSKKIKDLDTLFNTLSNDSKTITIKEFNILRKHAISKGGFLTSNMRRIFYKKIFCINNSNIRDMVYINLNNTIDIRKDVLQIKHIESKDKSFNKLETSPDVEIIKMDSLRSKISNIFLNKTFNETFNTNITNYIKNYLESFLSEITSLNGNTYSYFQGYHDIALYFLLLYYDKTSINTGIAVFQHFSEFFLKELLYTGTLASVYDGNKTSHFEILSSLYLLKEIIHILNPYVYELLMNTCTDGLPTFATSWVLSLFTHCIESSSVLYRLLDYFVVSHPIAVYHMSAWIIIKEITKAVKDNKETFCGDVAYFKFFQELNMETIDYDYYITITEDSMKKYPVNVLKDVYNKIGVKYYYPLATEDSYVLKWIMNHNKEEVKHSFQMYMKGQFNLLKSLFNNK